MARKAKAETQPSAEPALSALQLHALALVSKGGAKKVRDQLSVGKGQLVQFMVEVCGAIDVAAAGDADVTDKLDTLTLLGVILEKMPASTRAKLLKQVAEACGDWAVDGEPPAVSDAAKEAAIALLESASRKGEQARRGAVTGSLKLTLVQRDQRSVA